MKRTKTMKYKPKTHMTSLKEFTRRNQCAKTNSNIKEKKKLKKTTIE